MFSGLPRKTICQETGAVLHQDNGFKRNPSAASSGSPLMLLDEMAKALEGCPISSPVVDTLLKRYYSGER